jgi:alcohol dehydrogenase class IV
MSTQIILPRILQVGDGASKAVGTILIALECQRPLIVTDKMMVQLGYVGAVQES